MNKFFAIHDNNNVANFYVNPTALALIQVDERSIVLTNGPKLVLDLPTWERFMTYAKEVGIL